MKLMILSVLSVLSALSISAMAAPANVQIGTLAYGGNGCPAGTMSVLNTPDGTIYSLQPDVYLAHAGQASGRRIARASCNMAIPIRVAPGYQVSLVTLVAGYASALDAGSQVRVDHEQFFAGSRGPKLSKSFARDEQEFELTTAVTPSKLVWSACGASTNVRLNTSILAQANTRMDDTFGAIEEVRLRLVTRRCK